MKKIINISLILIIFVTICMLGTNVYAKSSATMQLNTNYNGGDDVVVEAKLSNLVTDRGVIALGTVLEYDKNVLELKEIVGQNHWVPSNSANGKIIVVRDDAPATTDEVVFTITFKVKNMRANSASITLKDVEIGDGGRINGEAHLNSATKTINIKEIDTPNSNPGTTTEPSGNGSQTANSNVSTSGNGSQATNSGVGTSGNGSQATNSGVGTSGNGSQAINSGVGTSGNGSQATNSGVGTSGDGSQATNSGVGISGNGSETTSTDENTSGNEEQTINPDENGDQVTNPDGNNKSNENADQDNIQTNGELPKTGKNNIFIIVLLAIIVVIVISVVCYIKFYKKKH